MTTSEAIHSVVWARLGFKVSAILLKPPFEFLTNLSTQTNNFRDQSTITSHIIITYHHNKGKPRNPNLAIWYKYWEKLKNPTLKLEWKLKGSKFRWGYGSRMKNKLEKMEMIKKIRGRGLVLEEAENEKERIGICSVVHNRWKGHECFDWWIYSLISICLGWSLWMARMAPSRCEFGSILAVQIRV